MIDTAIGLECGCIYLTLCEVQSICSHIAVNSIVISRTPQESAGKVLNRKALYNMLIAS
jgi:hypothetical protein